MKTAANLVCAMLLGLWVVPQATAKDMVGASRAVGIPAALAPFGKGFPHPGDVCRKLGESKLTLNWLSDDASLVGCPSSAAALQLGGQIVDFVMNVTLVSVPLKAKPPVKRYVEGQLDVADPTTGYHATGPIKCKTGKGKQQWCDAGVRRATSADGINLVEIKITAQGKRVVFFRGTKVLGAERFKSDKPGALHVKSTRKADDTVIQIGSENYVVPDALILGG